MSGVPPARSEILAQAVAPDHLKRIHEAQARFERFCARLRVPVCAEAVTLYLTWLAEDDETSGRALKRTVAALDAAARLDGRDPWSETPDVRRFVRGLHRQRAIGSEDARADPLYAELVHLLAAAVMSPTASQLRDRAAIVLWEATGLPSSALARLRWRDVRLRRSFAELRVPPPPKRPGHGPTTVRLDAVGGPLCPVLALRRLREAVKAGTLLVLGTTGGTWDRDQVLRAIRQVREHGGDTNAALAAVSVSPSQVRDRAILLIGYGAALRTHEAIRLSQGDVRETTQGLALMIPGRAQVSGVPGDPGQPDDPVTAWRDWLHILADQGLRADDKPAFPVVSGSRIWDRRLSEQRLNEIVQNASERATLEGRYVFTSLRSGLIRTALRADQQAHDIAAHTDLRSLGSVIRHQRREHLLTRSVAGQLGL